MQSLSPLFSAFLQLFCLLAHSPSPPTLASANTHARTQTHTGYSYGADVRVLSFGTFFGAGHYVVTKVVGNTPSSYTYSDKLSLPAQYKI